MLNQPPDISFDENGIPISAEFSDSYYSKMGGNQETQEIFIKACRLEEKIKSQNIVIIGETGFGTGLNFLSVIELFRKIRKNNQILHFNTFEKYPLSREQAAIALAKWPEFNEIAQELLQKWPIAINGLQRIWFEGNIALNIYIGDALEGMQNSDFKADCWFLDGFAPRSNPQLWSIDIFNQIRRLSSENVRIGTYTVAASVRENLKLAGFNFAKCEGFGNKKQRLEAWLDGDSKIKANKSQKIAIIGSGIAGAACFLALKRRGIICDIFDDDIEDEIKASNNPRGLLMPRLDRNDTNISRFFKQAFLYALDSLKEIGAGYIESKSREIAKTERDIEKYAMFAQKPPMPPEFLEINGDNLVHLKSGMVVPHILRKAIFGDIKIQNAKIDRIEKEDCGQLFSNNLKIGEYDAIIIANGAGIKQLLPFEIEILGRMGQISQSKIPFPPDELPMGANGYCLPLDNGTLFGASFKHLPVETTPFITQKGHEDNLKTLKSFAPNIAALNEGQEFTGRTSMRAVTKDTLPITGKIDDGLYVLGALGSRGFTLAFILGEYIAAIINDEPLPLALEQRKIISPFRFK